MAKLALIYGIRLLPVDDLGEVKEAIVVLKSGRTARVAMHLIEWSKKEMEVTLRQSIDAFDQVNRRARGPAALHHHDGFFHFTKVIHRQQPHSVNQRQFRHPLPPHVEFRLCVLPLRVKPSCNIFFESPDDAPKKAAEPRLISPTTSMKIH